MSDIRPPDPENQTPEESPTGESNDGYTRPDRATSSAGRQDPGYQALQESSNGENNHGQSRTDEHGYLRAISNTPPYRELTDGAARLSTNSYASVH